MRQAQLAALNPQVDRDTFLTVDPSTYVETKDLSFTNTSVVVKVSGKGLPKLNFVIAPGMAIIPSVVYFDADSTQRLMLTTTILILA